jgi:hypothetical protein
MRTLVTHYCKRIHPPWAQDNTKAAVSPYCSPPFVSRLAPTHLCGTRSDNLLVGPGTPPPGVGTPTVPFSLSASWACFVCSAFFALAVDRCVRTRARRQISRPRRPPTCPTPFLEPRQCPAHTPPLISLGFTLSRALPTPPAAAGDPRPCSRPSSALETVPSLPELRPKVRHPSPCPISLIAPYVRPISPSPVLDRGGSPCSRGGRPI